MTKRRLVFPTAALSLIFLLHSYALAQSPPFFGPTKYVRTTGAPNSYTDSFQACNTGATYKLLVENGEAGKNRVSSGIINLNGQEIIKQNDFSQKVDKIEKTVSLQPENTLDIKLTSGPDGFIKVSVNCVSNCLEVKITSPATQTTVNKSKTIIKGDLYNTFGETGVVLNSSGSLGNASALAQTQGANFAGIIPLQQGQNTITATATDACGYKTTDTITINTQTTQEFIRLTANPESGIPTLNVTFEAEAYLPNPVSSYSWDTDGDGTPDQTGPILSKITVTFQNPGLYFPKVTITDDKNNTYSETTIVNVLSREEMDVLLKGKWEGMKSALVAGNIEGGLTFLVDSAKDVYRNAFQVINAELPGIVNGMQDIQFIYADDKRVKYRINQIHDIDGTPVTLTYYIYFVKNGSGLWKIERF